MTYRIVFSVALLGLLAPPAAAQLLLAEVICAPRDQMVERLVHQHGARLSGQGLRDVETVMEVWTDAQGDWTLVQSRTDGIACIVAMGEAWETSAAPDPA